MKILISLAVALFMSTSLFAEQIEKEWTIYIHMNADNNLCSYSYKDLKEIKTLDVTANANIIVAFDCSKNGDSKIIEIQGNQEVDITKDILGENAPKEFNMGDFNFFSQTAILVFNKYPSKNKMIDVWNHGSGWDRKKFLFELKGVSYDDNSGSHITTIQMGEALKAISVYHHINILGYDACLMQMIEVIYEGSDFVDYTIASEDSEPADGWDYKGLVNSLSLNPSPEDLSKAIVDTYVEFYKEQLDNAYQEGDQELIDKYSSGVALSAIKSSELPALVSSLKDLVIKMKDQEGIFKIVSALPYYSMYAYKDLGTFLKNIPENLNIGTLELYNNSVFYNVSTEPATGISAYFTKYPAKGYADLRFSKDTGWYDFLLTMK